MRTSPAFATTFFLSPDFGERFNTIVTIPCTIAEVWMLGYLLVFGVKRLNPIERTLAAA